MHAPAYVGPGAGITLIGAVIGLVTAIFLAMFVVLRLQKPDNYKSGLGDAERERIIEWAAPTMIHYGYFAGTALP